MALKYLVKKEIKFGKLTFEVGKKLRVFMNGVERTRYVCYGSFPIFRLNSKEAKEHGVPFIENFKL